MVCVCSLDSYHGCGGGVYGSGSDACEVVCLCGWGNSSGGVVLVSI